MASSAASYKAAKTEALQKCRKDNANDCKLVSSFKNACVSLVVGGSNEYWRLFVHADRSQATASQMAMKKCQSAGYRNCEESKVSCSIPKVPN